MKRARGLCIFIIAIIAISLAGCGNRDSVDETDTTGWKKDIRLAKPRFTLAERLEILTWYDYLPQEVLDFFAQTYGTEIAPTLVGSNEEMLNLLQKNPGKYDLATPSDYMVTKMINNSMLRRLDHDNLPNMESLDEDVRRIKYDRGLQYCIPLFRLSLGVAFNIKYVSGIPRSWDFIVEQIRNDYLAHRAGILSEMRFAMGVSLMFLGYSPNTINPEEINKARDLLINSIKKRGLVLFHSDSDKSLADTDTLIGLTWSGSAAAALRRNPNIRFLLLEGQTLVTYDNLVIDAKTTRASTAEFFINYLLTPQVIAKISSYNFFQNSNSASLPFIPGIIRNGPGFLFPPEDERLFLEDVGEHISLYEEAWAKVLQAKPREDLVKLPLPKDGYFRGDSRSTNFPKQFNQEPAIEHNGAQ